MTTSPSIGGPVSEALDADVRSWVRRHGIVIGSMSMATTPRWWIGF